MKPDLVSPAVAGLTTALSPLGAAAGSFARAVACVVAERKRLTIMDRAIKLDHRLRERQLDLAAEFRERDSLRRTQVEMARIEAGERVAIARMRQEYCTVDALLTAKAESEIRVLHLEFERLHGQLALERFMVENVFQAVETVLNVNSLALESSRVSETALRRSLTAMTKMVGDPVSGPLAIEATASISSSLGGVLAAKYENQMQCSAAVREQFSGLINGWTR